MPVIELQSTDFTRVASGSFASEPEPSIYIVDSILAGSTSGTGSLKVSFSGNPSIRWIVGNPPITFGSNIRIGIAVKILDVSSGASVWRVRAGIFIGNNRAGIEVQYALGNLYYHLFFHTATMLITPNYFEQIILRQETVSALSYFSFSNQNTKNLVSTITYGLIDSGQAGFFLEGSSITHGTVLFDYFFIEEYIGA